MRTYLEKDIFIFSQLKVHTQLTEARQYLKDSKGDIRPYYDFEQKVLKLNKTYNKNYLEAEYEFAVQSSQSASNWANLQDDSNRYWLEYRTAGDERVRSEHEALNTTCLPKDDLFWAEFYPPNGWRCRCTAVEVLARDYTKSDSKKAITKGNSATTQIGKNGKNKLKMFRFNPGQSKKVFPPNNSYNKVVGAGKVKKEIKIKSKKDLKTTKDLSNYFARFSENNKGVFARGFKELKVTRQRGVNGFTDMNGVIALKKEVMQNCIYGINNIKNGIPTTLEQEIGLSTLNHEIWHNTNKKGNIGLTRKQIKTMELANEFVSRKTMPKFMGKLGGKLHNIELTNTRSNTGYNTMVVNYDSLIKWTKSDPKKVLEMVKKTLINDSYDNQMKGLSNAIVKCSEFELYEKNVKALIECVKDYDNSSFNKILKNNEKLITNR